MYKHCFENGWLELVKPALTYLTVLPRDKYKFETFRIYEYGFKN